VDELFIASLAISVGAFMLRTVTMLTRHLSLLLLFSGLVVATPSRAFAIDDSTKSAARELARDGKHDFDKGRFDESSRKFGQAYAVTHVPTLALWAARSLAKEGKFVAASEYYREATQLQKNELWLGNAQQQAQRQAASELEKLLPRIPRLTVEVAGVVTTEVDVIVDDVHIPNSERVAHPFDPGPHLVRATRGGQTVEVRIELMEGEQRKSVLTLSETSSAPLQTAPKLTPGPAPAGNGGSAPQRPKEGALAMPHRNVKPDERAQFSNYSTTLGWVASGVGAVGIVVGTVAGLTVKSRYGDYQSACPGNRCNSSIEQDKLDSYNTLRTVSTVGLIVGGIATAVGVTLLLTSSEATGTAKVGLFVSPNSAELSGSF
jgi:hypothetical protein